MFSLVGSSFYVSHSVLLVLGVGDHVKMAFLNVSRGVRCAAWDRILLCVDKLGIPPVSRSVPKQVRGELPACKVVSLVSKRT
jgi:hypothetical protein